MLNNPLVTRAHFYTLLTGVCALCEADSPDSHMSGLFCVTPFRTRGLHPLRRLRVYPSALCSENGLLVQTVPAAKLRGVQFGRKPKEKPPEYPAVLETWRRKELSARAAAVRLGVTHKTFQKWAEQDTLR